jgi:hypothetical protein
MRWAAEPIRLDNVIENLDGVHGLLERNAPYTPLGGWYRPGTETGAAIRPLWFQNDWVHADLCVEGADLFLFHERTMQAARDFYGAGVVIPHSVYVNLMIALDRAGPAHTDNPRFCGRDRSNTPMWLLRSMLWSGLFDDETITQATSIWWMNDVEGGGFLYWPQGPGHPPREYVGSMANTALVGDNHGMFHQVAPVGPFDRDDLRVTAAAELAPASDGSGDWCVIDRGSVRHRAPLQDYRVSVLWKADVYRDEEEHAQMQSRSLSLQEVCERFRADLAERGIDVRFDEEDLGNPATAATIAPHYPEASPSGALRSIFERPD